MSAWRRTDGLWLAPWVAAAMVAPAAAAPVHLTVAEQGGGARLSVRWEDGRVTAPQVSANIAGQTLTLRFAEPIEADMSSLTTLAPETIAAASIEGQTIKIALKRPLAARSAVNGEVFALMLDPKVEKAKVSPVEATASDAVLTVGKRDDLTRLSFLFQTGASVIPVHKGDVLDLRFSRAVDVDISQLKIMPPKFLKAAEKTSKPGAPLAIKLTLEPGVRHRSFVEGPRVVVDLMAPDEKTLAALKAKAAEPPKPPPEIDPAPPNKVVRVQMTESADQTIITTRWASPARAAAFRRGEALWILFDTHGKLDVSGLERVGRRHQDVQVVNGEGVTGLRIPTQPNMLISAKPDGATWTFVIGPRAAGLPAVADVERETPAQGARLTADFQRAGVVRWVADPEIGDRFGAALLAGPVVGIDTRRATLEAAILPSAQGAAIEPRADGVGATFEGGKLVVTRGAGLIANAASAAPAPAAASAATPAAASSGLLNLTAWGVNDKKRAIDVLAALQRTAAAEGFEPGARADARMNLARFLLANELAAETLGALRAAQINQPELELDAQFKLMRAAANLMMGRARDAQVDLGAGVLADDPSAALWRGYGAALTENWAEARRQFEMGQGALGALPQNWRARFNLALAQSALELNDFAAADAALAKAAGEATTEDVRAHAEILRARLLEARGDLVGAVSAFQGVQKSANEASAVRAILETTRLQRVRGQLSASDAINMLEALRYRWRGDGLELEIIQTLGRIYQDEGRWREGLAVMHAAAARFPDLPAARRLRLDMAEAFERLFLEGEADTLEPIQALGLFYEFKDLTPIGADGDRMIRLLSARLVGVDLLEKAEQLLQYQVDNRLEGVGQAQVAADLAAIYVADRQPEKALLVIENTRQPGVPADIAGARRIVEARALIELGRFEHALELLEKDQSVDAMRVRAEAAWRQKKWADAIKWTSVVLERGPKSGEELTPEERVFVLRTAIACVLAGDAPTIAKLRATYAQRMAATADADAFEMVTSGIEPGDVRLRDVAKQIARVDLVERVLADIKARLAKPTAPTAKKPAPLAQADASMASG